MEIENINVSSYPGSKKIYKKGKIHDIKVGMRKISQYPTVRIVDGIRKEYPNESVTVYDTSGPYTDPDMTIDINRGLPRIREKWVENRNDTLMLYDITSEYGKKRRGLSELDPIRFPVMHRPRIAKPGKESLRCFMRAKA